jgi:hypothetical protein
LVFQDEHKEEKLQKTIEVLFFLGLSVRRIGFVKKFFLQSDIELLKNLFIKEKISNLSIKEIGVQFNISREINNFSCNSIEKISLGKLVAKNVTEKGLIILKDCNTLEENFLPDDLSEVNMSGLINEMNKEANNFVLIL